MGFKTTFELFALVCVLGAIILLVANPFDPTEEQTGALIEARSEDVNRLKIERGDTRLDCRKDDWEWFIKFPVEARANSARIERFLGVLETLTIQDAVTSAQRQSRGLSLSDYGLSPPYASLSLKSPQGATTLLVGSKTPLGNSVYVKKADSDLVLSTDAGIKQVLPENVRHWRNRQVFSGRDEKTLRIELWNPDGSFIQILRKDSMWQMTQPVVARANGRAVEQLLEQLYALKVTEFMWDPGWSDENDAAEVVAESRDRFAPYGLADDQARAKVAVWQKGDRAGQELLLGKSVSEESEAVYARSRGTDSIYSVSSNVLDYLDLSVGSLRSRKLFVLTPEETGYINIQADNKRLTLFKESSGHWVIEEPLKWDADRKTTEAFLDGLLNLEAENFVSEPVTNLTELGFNPPAWSVEVLEKPPAATGKNGGRTDAQDNTETVGLRSNGSREERRLLVARSTRDQNSVPARFSNDPVKFGDEGFVYSLSKKDMAFAGRDPASALRFFDRTMLSLRPENIKSIEAYMQGRKDMVVRDEKGKWVPLEETLREVHPEAIDSILFAVSNLRASRVEDHAVEEPAAYGLENPSIQFSFGLSGQGGIQKTLKLGYKAKTQGIYAMIQGRDVVFVLSHDTVKLLLQPLTQKEEPGQSE